ncbi:hypothetical protein EJ110_NYTH48180 [Nymphaea thermarum]|nr:hypothetical protein EJ110_NYTH48180 [Nymphaea thermarum]
MASTAPLFFLLLLCFVYLLESADAAPPARDQKMTVTCNNKKYPSCYSVPPQNLQDCNRPGAVCDNPRFVGGDGTTFYFHGKKDKDFRLRDFTRVQSIGVLFRTHKLFLGAKKVAQWDDAVDQLAIAFDGEPVFLPTTEKAEWTAADSFLTVTRSGPTTNEVVVEAPNSFKITAKVVSSFTYDLPSWKAGHSF